MSKNPRTSNALCVLDCLSGARTVVAKSPFVVGSASSADMRIHSPKCPPVLCSIELMGSAYEVKINPNFRAIVNGSANDRILIERDQEHSVAAAGQLLAFRHAQDHENWAKKAEQPAWYIFDLQANQWTQKMRPSVLADHLSNFSEARWAEMIVLPEGMELLGFYPHDIKDSLGLKPKVEEAPKAPEIAEQIIEEINSEYGEFTCPICWFKFDRGDCMNIAVHASLRGDSQLGDEHMQRFYATSFNDRGQALDAMGMTTRDLACPHCRRKLPTGFLDMKNHIFSIVGAPSSGKSYYLSVLVKMLQASLFRNFSVSFRDADPSQNVILTQMKNQLFSAATPQDAQLAKTELEGALYETLPRQGRKVKLPRPFVFRLSPLTAEREGFSVVFYDNAGEHFEPTRDSADSPGAQHIAVASGIFFLFDPLYNNTFKQRLTDVFDPQMEKQKLDQQDVILAESEVRIKSILGMDTLDRIKTPVAVMVGKCDTWEHLLGEPPLLPAVVDQKLSLANVQANSRRIRDLLMDICPEIVSNAEAISSNVAYFALSPLGCSPVKFTDRNGIENIGPDPKQIKPRYVEDPTLWVLSQIAPSFVPSEI